MIIILFSSTDEPPPPYVKIILSLYNTQNTMLNKQFMSYAYSYTRFLCHHFQMFVGIKRGSANSPVRMNVEYN
jgi:hypothetical protein